MTQILGAAGPAQPPLSFSQEQLWFIDRFAPGLPTYNIPIALRLSGALDTAALRRGLDAVVARHEALRTRLGTVDGGRTAQVVSPPAPVPLQAALMIASGLFSLWYSVRARAISGPKPPLGEWKFPYCRGTFLSFTGSPGG